MNKTIWQVQIHGRAGDLEYLSRNFTSMPRKITKIEKTGEFLLEAESFSTCQNPEDVLRFAILELAILSGALKLFRTLPATFSPIAVYKNNPTGGRHVFLYMEDTVLIHDDLVEIISTDKDGITTTARAESSKPVAIAQLAATDPAVAQAMRLLSAPDHESWVGMYRIYEVIEADIGNMRSLQKRGWEGANQDVKRFKHSANSIAVAGDSARHGKESGAPPTNPMSREEAVAFLNNLLHTWLSDKGV